MPVTSFICPDGNSILIADCLQNCRLYADFEAGRCLSLRTLTKMAEQRVWNGIPSTTQLIVGTREAMLRITENFAVSPQTRVFALFGTAVHAALESVDTNEGLAECRLTDEISSGQFDLYDAPSRTLYDVKTYGSYKVACVIGLRKKSIADGYYKNGKPKFRTVWEPGGVKDRLDLGIQLNDYAYKLEDIGFPVDNRVAEVLVRDGGTYIARSRGIDFHATLVSINKISRQWIKAYMRTKRDRLLHALETGEMPPPCKPRETWHGVKCERFCDVWSFCNVGKSLRKEEDSE